MIAGGLAMKAADIAHRFSRQIWRRAGDLWHRRRSKKKTLLQTVSGLGRLLNFTHCVS